MTITGKLFQIVAALSAPPSASSRLAEQLLANYHNQRIIGGMILLAGDTIRSLEDQLLARTLGIPAVITINVPVVFMARYVMVLRIATSLRGALEGVGPEYRDFFEASAIWAQKSNIFMTSILCRGGYFLLHNREQLSTRSLSNIKISAVQRGEEISKKIGEMSCNFGEIIKKLYFLV